MLVLCSWPDPLTTSLPGCRLQWPLRVPLAQRVAPGTLLWVGGTLARWRRPRRASVTEPAGGVRARLQEGQGVEHKRGNSPSWRKQDNTSPQRFARWERWEAAGGGWERLGESSQASWVPLKSVSGFTGPSAWDHPAQALLSWTAPPSPHTSPPSGLLLVS